MKKRLTSVLLALALTFNVSTMVHAISTDTTLISTNVSTNSQNLDTFSISCSGLEPNTYYHVIMSTGSESLNLDNINKELIKTNAQGELSHTFTSITGIKLSDNVGITVTQGVDAVTMTVPGNPVAFNLPAELLALVTDFTVELLDNGQLSINFKEKETAVTATENTATTQVDETVSVEEVTEVTVDTTEITQTQTQIEVDKPISEVILSYTGDALTVGETYISVMYVNGKENIYSISDIFAANEDAQSTFNFSNNDNISQTDEVYFSIFKITDGVLETNATVKSNVISANVELLDGTYTFDSKKVDIVEQTPVEPSTEIVSTPVPSTSVKLLAKLF